MFSGTPLEGFSGHQSAGDCHRHPATVCRVVRRRADRAHLLTCQSVLAELASILAAKFHMPAELITQSVVLAIPIPDPDDVTILAAARAGGAACFVTGDKALLELGEVDTMPILSPRQYWERFHLGR